MTSTNYASYFRSQRCFRTAMLQRGLGYLASRCYPSRYHAYLANIKHLPPEGFDFFIRSVVKFQKLQVNQLRHVLLEFLCCLVQLLVKYLDQWSEPVDPSDQRRFISQNLNFAIFADLRAPEADVLRKC